MQAIIDAVHQSTAFIIELGLFVVAAIAVYRQIRDKLREEAKDELRSDLLHMVAGVQRGASNFNHTLVNKIELSKAGLQTVEGKIELSLEALKERSTKSIKKAGLSDDKKLRNFVEHTYNQLSPLLRQEYTGE